MSKPIPCEILKVTWQNGDVSLYPHAVGDNTKLEFYLDQGYSRIRCRNPLTARYTLVFLENARDVSVHKGTIRAVPARPDPDEADAPPTIDLNNPLNQKGMYGDPLA